MAYGTAQRGVAGAGVAHSQDAMSGTINPANLAPVGTQLSFGAEVFSPRRSFTGDGTVFLQPGTVESGREFFLIPNFAYNKSLQNGGVFNITAYGNGGMNTSYPDGANANCAGFGGGSGPFCGGAAGINLMQLFVSATYAQQNGGLSWGISPTLAVQSFNAEGLGAFGVTNTDVDTSFGVGLRAGVSYEFSPSFSIGVAGQTKFNMSKFDTYAGLFENGGDFDIPASVTAGVKVKPSDGVTVMVDVQKIYYSDVPAVGNATTAGPLGAAGGAGFGWDDVDVIRLGVEWEQSQDMTWRFGYARASNPVGPEDVTLNVLAPGVVQDHFTFGGAKTLNERDTLDFAISYVSNNSVTGTEVTPFGPTPNSAIEIQMHQLSASVGWTRRF